MKQLRKSILFFVATAGMWLWAQDASTYVGRVAASAGRFLNGLSADQKAAAKFRFEDEERFDFHYFPRARKGISFKEMTEAQRKLAHAFLDSGLSSEGSLKVERIMQLEEVLWELEGRNPIRDPDLYYISIFGVPSRQGVWGWRVEGHHLSLNFTFKDGKLVSWTPSFFGANPAEVRQGAYAGRRVLADEEDGGRRLLRSMTGDQRAKAVIEETAPADILTGVQRHARLNELQGIPFTELSIEQAELLLNLIGVFAGRLRAEQAESEIEKIREAGFDWIRFAWAGGANEREPHYYRIHGPDFVIEYDNTQNDANHIHTVWRDFKNDFGRDALAEHYARHHDSRDEAGTENRALSSHSHSHSHSHERRSQQ